MGQEDSSNIITKKLHSAPKEANKSEIAIVDQRIILRDAFADSIRPALGCKILTTDSADSLLKTPFKSNPVSTQIIVLCDGGMELINSKQELEKLRDFFPESKKVVLTDYTYTISYRELKYFGVKGIIPSIYNREQFVACLKAIEVDIECIPPYVVENSTAPSLKSTESTESTECSRLSEILTPRQLQIMDFIAIGRSNKFVAAELSLSESTVKVHVHNIMKHLGATNRTHATHIINEMHEREMRICSVTDSTDDSDGSKDVTNLSLQQGRV